MQSRVSKVIAVLNKARGGVGQFKAHDIMNKNKYYPTPPQREQA